MLEYHPTPRFSRSSFPLRLSGFRTSQWGCSRCCYPLGILPLQDELQSLEVILVLFILAELLCPQRVPLGPYRLQDRSLGRAEEGFGVHQVSEYCRHLLSLANNRQSLLHQLHMKGDDVQLQVGNVLAHLQLGVRLDGVDRVPSLLLKQLDLRSS